MPSRNYSYRFSSRRPAKKITKSIIQLVIFFVLVFSLFLIGKYFLNREDIKDFSSTTIIKPVKIIDVSTELKAVLIKYPEITAGVSIAPYDREEIQNFGTTESFVGASTTKVLSAVYYYHLVEEGKVSLDEYLSSYKADWHLKQMINQSNNNSWHLLNTKVGYQNLENYGHSIGLTSYKWNGNTITAADQALLLKKLANGELINDNHRALLYSYMQNTNREDLIPPAVPLELSLYHKYGLLYGNLHDIGIITDGKKTLPLVILTNVETTVAPEKRTQFFYDVSKVVIDAYF